MWPTGVPVPWVCRCLWRSSWPRSSITRRVSSTTASDREMGWTAITNIIRRLRFEHREMTQQELAERIGVTRQTVNAIEAGKYSPSLEVAFRIAEVFGLRVDEVFGYQKRAHK